MQGNEQKKWLGKSREAKSAGMPYNQVEQHEVRDNKARKQSQDPLACANKVHSH